MQQQIVQRPPVSEYNLPSQNQESSSSLERIVNGIGNAARESLDDLVGDIEAIKEQPEPEMDENRQDQKPVEAGERDEAIEQLEMIRRKEMELMEQLKALRLEQERLLAGKSRALINEEEKQPEEQPKEDEDQEKEQQQQQQSGPTTAKTLSPLKFRRYAWQKPRPKLPEPIVPQMSRQQFQQRVKQIACSIRSKVNKTNQIRQSPNAESKDKKYKPKYEFVELPQINAKANKRLPSNGNAILNSIVIPNEDINASELPEQDQLSPASPENKIEKAMRWIVEQIIKKAMQKIRYKQKYGLKLDPVHHKYPMTSFRKKIIEEKQQREKTRYLSQSLRQSALHQRKEIFDKSRYK